MRTEAYNIDLHKHLYACWCAASAYGRGLKNGGNETAFALIQASGLQCVTSPDDMDEDVDAWLLGLMNKIMVKAELMGLDGFSFGRAQKLVSIYLKTVLVCGEHHSHRLVVKLPPPLDRQLFNGLKVYLRDHPDNPGKDAFLKAQSVRSSWTTFTDKDYVAHVAALKLIMGSQPLYFAEEHWRL
jgi:hypothetical protein